MSQGAMSIAERLALRRGGIAKNQAKGLRTFKFPAGKTLFRIIPQPGYPENVTETCFGVEKRFGVTYLKSLDGKNIGSIGDREITYGQDDPVRNMIFEAMRQSPSDELKKHYREMLANPRIVFCALILNHPTLQNPQEPVLIEVSETAFDSGILAQAEVWGATGIDVFDPNDGHVFQVEKSGTGLETSYTWAVTPTKAQLGKAVLDKVIDLDAWVESQFEGKEQRIFEALSKLNASAGLTIAAPQASAGALPSPMPAALPQPTPTAPQTPAAQPMVTHAIEADEAEYTEVETIAEPTPAAAPVAPAAAAPVAPVTPAAPPVATPPAADAEPDLASILASLS